MFIYVVSLFLFIKPLLDAQKILNKYQGGTRMLKKIREGEKGFTLVELLAVIVILGIIVAIAIPAIGSVINRAEGDADEQEQGLIIDAARLYEIQNGQLDAEDGVDTDTLMDEGYLEERQGDVQSGKVIRTVGTEDDPSELEFIPDSGGGGGD